MAINRPKAKGRKERGSFAAVPHAVLGHPNYAVLSPRAVKLLWDLYAQYRGQNNGDLCAAFSVMRKKGWTSKDQLWKATTELRERGWIVVTRQGGRHKANLYAVTFQAVDECNGKLDMKPTAAPLGTWKQVPRKLETVPRHTDHIDPPHGPIEAEVA